MVGECTLLHPAHVLINATFREERNCDTDSAGIDRYTLTDAQETHTTRETFQNPKTNRLDKVRSSEK